MQDYTGMRGQQNIKIYTYIYSEILTSVQYVNVVTTLVNYR